MLLCCFLLKEDNSLGDPCNIAKGRYGSHETISIQNSMRFPKTLIDVNAKGLLN